MSGADDSNRGATHASTSPRARREARAADLLGGADICDISDACDQLAVPAVRTGAIKPAYPGCAAAIGIITTVTLAPGAGMPLHALTEAFANADDEAGIVLVDLGGRTDVQCWGTVLATVARLCGMYAAVVNGAVRDASDLAELDFRSYARGVHPAGMRGRLLFAGAGRDVVIEEQPVPSGWMAAADANGVIFFSPDRADRVFELAGEIAGKEQKMLARARAAAGVADALEILLNRPPAGPKR